MVLQELLGFISLFINFVFANLLILKSLRLPETQTVAEIPKYEKSPLTLQTKSDILARLEKLMLQEKLFLNSSLNLGEVARKLSVVPRYLSQVINELKEQNFYDYVNGYRIEEAKKILSDPAHDSEKILSILYDCGYNSKSVFNSVFKRTHRITPSNTVFGENTNVVLDNLLTGYNHHIDKPHILNIIPLIKETGSNSCFRTTFA